MSRIIMKWPGFLDRALTLSYDDGVTSDKKMIEILDRYGIKCTFNINSMCFDEREPKVLKEGEYARLSTKAALELFEKNGHEVAIHTETHPYLTNLPVSDMIEEVLGDRKKLEKLFGKVIRGMAYPYGVLNDDVIEVLKVSGILYARTTVSTENYLIPNDWLRLPATCHHKNPRLFDILNSFLTRSPLAPYLFYLWGHSYEFERDGNWDLLERFCEAAGNKDDVWYANNTDVFEYVTAYKSLWFSADLSKVYNPSALTVYFTVDGQKYSVAPAQTLSIQ